MLLEEHLADLNKSGLSKKTIEAAGIYSDGPDKLVFPYPGNNGFTRVKLFPPKLQKDGTLKKYHQDKDTGIPLYFPPGFEPDGDVTRMTEGEKKGLRGTQEGLNVFSMGGIWNFAKKDKNGEPQLIADFDQLELIDKVIEIVPDADFQEKEQVKQAVCRLANLLEGRGAIVKIVCLPLAKGLDKLDDFLCKKTVDDFLKLKRVTSKHSIFKDVKTKEKKISKERGTQKDGRQILIQSKFSPRPFTERLLGKYKLRSTKSGEFYIYDQKIGLWSDKPEVILEKELRTGLLGPENAKRYYTGEIMADVKSLCLDLEDSLEPNPRYIAVQNGIFDLETEALAKFSPDFFFQKKVGTRLKPSGRCDFIDSIFSELVSNTTILYQICAYCLYRGYPNHKIFFLYGGGGNGKSVFVSILAKLLGQENISTVTLDDVQDNRFASSQLYQKLTNISGEMSYGDLRKTDLLKRLTGEDSILGEKKHQEPFAFKNYAKVIFVGNELPQTSDKTQAFYRRLSLIEFPNKFEGEQADRNLMDKISTEEIEGLLFKSVVALLKMYRDNFKFSNEERAEEMGQKYERLTNPLNTFLGENCKNSFGGYITKQEFRDRFFEWLKEQNLRVWSEKKIGGKMKNDLGYEEGRPTIGGGKRGMAWLGIEWKA